MLELLFEVFGEFLLQAIGEVLFEIGLHSLAQPFRKRRNPWVAAIGYAFLGAVAGGLSLLVFQGNFASQSWRIANLIITPIAVGGIMALVGAVRSSRGQELFRIDRFAYGYLFALSLALIRYWFAR
ncbi:MAG: hypothetical protein ABIS28_22235 [Caldimonas sp.]